MENLEEKVLESLQKVFNQKGIISSVSPEDFSKSFWFLLDNVNIQESLAQTIWEQQNPTKVKSFNSTVNVGIH